MDDADTPDHQEELSKDDLAVLRAFHNLDFSTADNSSPLATTPETSLTHQSDTDQSAAFLSEDDMLALFATEAGEDITTMRLAVQQFEQDNRLDSQGLNALKRCTHKVAGTAAAIGCASMPAIARHVEAIIKLVEDGSLAFQTGLIALFNSVQALEATLHSIVSNGFESKNPLLELEEEYKRLSIDVHVVHNEAFLLRSLPFGVLVTRLRRAIDMIAGAQSERIHVEVSGETVEINQDVLEKLSDPLLELVQMQIAEALFFTKRSEQDTDQSHQIGFNAHSTGTEITIEISFSQSVPSEAVAPLQDTVHHLYGSVSLQEKDTGKISLQLRLPRSQRMIQGLLVRAGSQHVIVSVSQVKRIHFNKQGMNGPSVQERNTQHMLLVDTHEIYHLNTLLGLRAHSNTAEKILQTALILELDNPRTAIEVDEVVKEVELVMKPLSDYLCQPGITSTAIDANGKALLVLNLPEMIRLKELYQQVGKTIIEAGTDSDQEPSILQPGSELCRKILIADDSIYIRQSINMTLSHEGYAVLEAVDGLQALDQLSKEAPDLLLLDIEMPNLNGYDVLNIIRSHQEYSALKIIMLTSRSSEKHKRRAIESGANAYLTKPCPLDILLKTIKSLFEDEDERTQRHMD
jgi:CheY-like chemotaxis protein